MPLKVELTEKLEFIVKLLHLTILRYSHKTVDDQTTEIPIFDQIEIVTSVDEKKRLEKVTAYEKEHGVSIQ